MGKKTGALIKEARTAAGLTQEALAKKVDGVSASDISKAERGEAELTQAALKQIAKATGVTQTSLLNAEKGESTAKKPAASKPAAKTSSKTGAEKTSSKTAAKTTAKTEEVKLTAAEKTLLKLYREADADTRKAAVSLLKGEKTDVQQMLTTMLGDALTKFMK